VELDFRNLNVKKLFDFSKEEENLIFEVYDKLLKFTILLLLKSKTPLFMNLTPLKKYRFLLQK
jgi:hypothetical protein